MVKTLRILALAIILALVAGLLPTVVGAPNAKASADPTYSISLSSSASTVATDGGFTLLATPGSSGIGSGNTIQIWRTSPRVELVKSCTYDQPCGAGGDTAGYLSVSDVDIKNSTFKAVIVSGSPTTYPSTPVAESDPVDVSRSPFTVSLTANETTDISTTNQTALVATANQTVSSTNQSIIVYNRTTGKILGSCNRGAVCSVQSKIYNEPSHEIIAYVATSVGGSTTADATVADSPSGKEAQSSVISITRKSFSVTLSTSNPLIQTTQSATLTATANQTTAGSNYYIFIYNRTLNRIEAGCKAVSCSFPAQIRRESSHDYVAYISTNIDGKLNGSAADSPSGLEATASVVTVNRVPWSIALNVTPETAPVGTVSTATATVNQSVTGSGFRIIIYDRTAGRILKSCSEGTSCMNDYPDIQGQVENGRHNLVAYLADSINGSNSYYAKVPDAPVNLAAESNQVVRERPVYEVTLSTNRVTVPAQTAINFSGTINQNTANTGYYAILYNKTTGEQRKTDVWHGQSLTWIFSNYSAGPEDYILYVAKDVDANGNPVDLQAKSRTIRISPPAFAINVGYDPATGEKTVYLNQHLPLGYSFYIYHYNTGRIIGKRGPGTHQNNPLPDDNPPSYGIGSLDTSEAFRFYIAESIDGSDSKWDEPRSPRWPTNIEGFLASADSSKPMPGGYQGFAMNRTSVGNASPNLCVCQEGDPVDLGSGALTENVADAHVPATGMSLTHERSYNSDRANIDGPMGKGWSTPWATQLDEDTATHEVTIRFDDGSTDQFKLEAGAWEPQTYSGSSLTSTGGVWSLKRVDGETWKFTSSGRLFKKTDALGNFLEATYNNGELTKVEHSNGQALAYGWSSGRISSVTTPGGKTYGYSYTGDRLATVTYPDNSQDSYGYNSSGRLASFTNRNGDVTTNEYSSSGKVESQEDPEGGVLAFAYGDGYTDVTQPNGRVDRRAFDQGQMTSETRGFGSATPRTWVYTYDPNTRAIASVIDPYGKPEKFTYNARGLKTSHTLRTGQVESWAYNSSGKLLSTTDFAGNVTTVNTNTAGLVTSASRPFNGGTITNSTTYASGSAPGQVASVTNGAGEVNTMEYDSRGLTTAGVSPGGARTEYTYGTDGQLLSSTDPYGFASGATPTDHKVSYTLDAMGRVLTTKNQDDSEATFTYDGIGNVLTSTDEEGLTDTYVYDGMSRITKVTAADGTETTFGYNAGGYLAWSEDKESNRTTFTTNIFGERTKVQTPTGSTTELTYDLLGRVVTAKNGLGGVETYTYDAEGRVLTEKNAMGGITTNTYDGAGRLSTTKSADNQTTTFTYDVLGNVKKTTLNDGAEISSTYDSEGRVLTRTDARGKVTTFTYNAKGLLASEVDPLGRTTTYQYDIAGLPTKTVADDGTETSFTYDKVGNLVEKDYTGSTPDVEYTYDDAGKRLTMVDGTGTTTYSYDAGGRVSSVTDGHGDTVSYTYNSRGAIAKITYPGGYEVTRSYDASGRLVTVKDGDDRTHTFTYDNFDQLATWQAPNGVKEEVLRNVGGDITNVNVLNGTSTLAQWTYTVANSGRISSVADSVAPSSPSSMGYSATNRLTSGEGSGFSYDAVGNLTKVASGNKLAYDNGDQLTTVKTASDVLEKTFGYDARGNRVSEDAVTGDDTSYAWDAENRLKTLTKGSISYGYEYDGDGLRSVTDDGTGDEEFTWDRASGSPTLLADEDNFYIYGPNGIVIEQVNRTTEDPIYLHFDAVGSVRKTTNQAGATMGSASFGLYGQKLGVVTTGTPFGFAGQYEDASGMLAMGARHYDPATGQFLSADPLYAQTGERYSYASGDPLRFVDPSGMIGVPGPLRKVGAWAGGKVSSAAGSISATTSDLASRTVSAAAATGSWINAHKGTIVKVGTVVAVVGGMAACTAVTAGGCLVLTGVIGAGMSALDYSVNADCFSVGGMAKQVAFDSLMSFSPMKKFKAGKEALALKSGAARGIEKKASKEVHHSEQLDRVGRWMSEAEYDKMIKTGRVQENSAGRSFVSKPPTMGSFNENRTGVFVEYNVPSSSLHQGGKKEWFTIPGPNAGTAKFGELPKEMPPATCITRICTR